MVIPSFMDYNRNRMKMPPSEKYAIINADDLGFSAGITEGILRAHREGIVTSSTLTANMPAAAAAVARLGEVPLLGVGVHLNVSQGPPLSQAGRELAAPGEVLNFTAARVIMTAALRPWMISRMMKEFAAQIEWALDHGLRPTHLDSHRHAHAFPPIFEGVQKLAKHYNVPFVRWHREVLPGSGWPPTPRKQRRISRILNVFGRVNGLFGGGVRGTRGTWGVRHTGLVSREFLIKVAASLPPGVTEIMTHPGLVDDLDGSATRLLQCRLDELAALCDPLVREEFEKNRVKRIHYGTLRDLCK
jgi:predicted glycoside hydrolase/deacetylase ChbG (UPF0249 family)